MRVILAGSVPSPRGFDRVSSRVVRVCPGRGPLAFSNGGLSGRSTKESTARKGPTLILCAKLPETNRDIGVQRVTLRRLLSPSLPRDGTHEGSKAVEGFL